MKIKILLLSFDSHAKEEAHLKWFYTEKGLMLWIAAFLIGDEKARQLSDDELEELVYDDRQDISFEVKCAEIDVSKAQASA